MRTIIEPVQIGHGGSSATVPPAAISISASVIDTSAMIAPLPNRGGESNPRFPSLTAGSLNRATRTREKRAGEAFVPCYMQDAECRMLEGVSSSTVFRIQRTALRHGCQERPEDIRPSRVRGYLSRATTREIRIMRERDFTHTLESGCRDHAGARRHTAKTCHRLRWRQAACELRSHAQKRADMGFTP